jgi:predicted amidohydrolase
MSMTQLRVAACQWQIRPARDFGDFAAHAAEVVAAAASSGAELLVLPEYVTYELLASVPGYQQLDRPRLDIVFEEVFGEIVEPLVALFQGLAARHRLTILTGTTWHAHEAGGFANSTFLVGPAGLVGRQTKVHVTPPEESPTTVLGTDLLVSEVGGVRVGVAICYDIEFPEVARTLAEQGVTLILTPSLTATQRGVNRVRLCAQARAIEHGVFVVSAPLLGSLGLPVEKPLTGYGQAAIFGPIEETMGHDDGVVATAPAGLGDTLAVASLDFAALARARTESQEAPTWRHRRPALYIQWRSDLHLTADRPDQLVPRAS